MKGGRREETVEVERLAQTGEGVARGEGSQLFVPGALPGERVVVRALGRGRAELLRVLQPSPERVAPRCSVVDTCGGCTWQHASAAVQREARLATLRRALPPALRNITISYVPAPEAYGYRTRARLAWRVERGRVVLGFRARASHDVVDAPGCATLVPALDVALGPLRVALAELPTGGELHLALGRGGAPVAALRPDAVPSAEGFKVPARLVALGFAGASVRAPGAGAAVVEGDPRPFVRGADGEWLVLAPEGFAQANEPLNESLGRLVRELANAADATVLELYAGAGNFTVLLARDAARVVAVESERAAVDALRENLSARGIENVSPVAGDAAGEVSTRRADIVVLDPPRTGAREVCEAMAKRPPRRVVYVSCDAATFGRDLGTLSGAMQVVALRAFEMFPQTPHLETVALLERLPSRGRGVAGRQTG